MHEFTLHSSAYYSSGGRVQVPHKNIIIMFVNKIFLLTMTTANKIIKNNGIGQKKYIVQIKALYTTYIHFRAAIKPITDT